MRKQAVDSAEQERMREQIRERFDELRGRDLADAEVDAEVRRLLAIGEPAIPIILEQFKDEDETLLAVATQVLKAWAEPRPVEPLIALLRNPAVGDLAKALILNVLEKYGLDVDGPELLGLSIDLEDYQVNSSGNGGSGEKD
jgi:HEAT repeat protein